MGAGLPLRVGPLSAPFPNPHVLFDTNDDTYS